MITLIRKRFFHLRKSSVQERSNVAKLRDLNRIALRQFAKLFQVFGDLGARVVIGEVNTRCPGSAETPSAPSQRPRRVGKHCR